MGDEQRLLWHLYRQQWQSRLVELRLEGQELSGYARELCALAAELRAESRALRHALQVFRGHPPKDRLPSATSR